MKIEDFDLTEWLKFLPEEGKLLFGEDRMLLLRQDAMGRLWFLLNQHLGQELTNTIMTQFGFRCGYGDFKVLNQILHIEDNEMKIATGPMMHNWEGIVHVQMEDISMDLINNKFFCKGKWFNSYEAENYLKNFKKFSEHPVCHSFTGYASGWCSAFSDVETVAIETQCIGMGHDHCCWEIRDIASWEGKADRWIAYLKNSTENISKKLENAVSELNHLNENLEEKIQRRTAKIKSQQQKLLASAKLGAIGEMAGGIAHEIKNPLAVISGHSSVIRKKLQKSKLTDEVLLEHLDKIDSTVEMTNKIVNGLKNLSRDTSMDGFKEFEVGQLLEDVLGITQAKFKTGRLPLEVLKPDEKIKVFGERVQLGQVLLNLLNNAYDEVSSIENSWVRLEISKTKDFVAFKVIDSGPGLDEEASQKIFDPFFTTKEVGKGTGLGLSISKSIIESHNGRLYIDFDSKNTCFVVELSLNPETSKG